MLVEVMGRAETTLIGMDSSPSEDETHSVTVRLSVPQIRMIDAVRGGRSRQDLVAYVVDSLLAGRIEIRTETHDPSSGPKGAGFGQSDPNASEDDSPKVSRIWPQGRLVWGRLQWRPWLGAVAVAGLAVVIAASVSLNVRQFQQAKSMTIEADRQLQVVQDQALSLEDRLEEWRLRAEAATQRADVLGAERTQLLNKVVSQDAEISALQQEFDAYRSRTRDEVLEEVRRESDRLRRASGGRIAVMAPSVGVDAAPLPPAPAAKPVFAPDGSRDRAPPQSSISTQ